MGLSREQLSALERYAECLRAYLRGEVDVETTSYRFLRLCAYETVVLPDEPSELVDHAWAELQSFYRDTDDHVAPREELRRVHAELSRILGDDLLSRRAGAALTARVAGIRRCTRRGGRRVDGS